MNTKHVAVLAVALAVSFSFAAPLVARPMHDLNVASEQKPQISAPDFYEQNATHTVPLGECDSGLVKIHGLAVPGHKEVTVFELGQLAKDGKADTLYAAEVYLIDENDRPIISEDGKQRTMGVFSVRRATDEVIYPDGLKVLAVLRVVSPNLYAALENIRNKDVEGNKPIPNDCTLSHEDEMSPDDPGSKWEKIER